MSIDWSNAPEGATHWDTGTNNRVAGWMRLDCGIWYWWPAEGAFSCPKKWHASLNQHMVKSEAFIARRTYWIGEGLPPAGTVCEIRAHKLNDWHEAEIKFASRNVVVWDWVGEPSINGLCTAYVHAIEIRPIRTQEQIAADEREHSIRNACTAISVALNGLHESEEPTAVAIIEAMIDAGFQQVAP